MFLRGNLIANVYTNANLLDDDIIGLTRLFKAERGADVVPTGLRHTIIKIRKKI
jgi:hypothetical protein